MQKGNFLKIFLVMTMFLFLLITGGCGGGGSGGDGGNNPPMPLPSPTLSGLQLSSGTLVPAFTPTTTQYAVSVANSVTSVTVTPTTASASASISVNGTNVPGGSAGAAVNLNVGANTITIIVENSAGSTTYTVTVTRDLGLESPRLSSLFLSSGTLVPTFSPTTTQYTASVANTAASVTVTPATASASASISINGTNVPSGSPSGAIALNLGPNTVTIVVGNAAASTTYSLTVSRSAPHDSGYWADAADTSWWDTASNDSSFSISTPQQLTGVAKLVNERKTNFSGATITLAGDINLAGREWEMITGSFRGVLDGSGHEISNMKISSGYGDVGLFLTLEQAGTVKNVKLTNTDIKLYPG
jgi:hypothetical protein